MIRTLADTAVNNDMVSQNQAIS